jgi:hypothetical protein
MLYNISLFVDGEKQDILVTAWYAPDIPVRFGPIGYRPSWTYIRITKMLNFMSPR